MTLSRISCNVAHDGLGRFKARMHSEAWIPPLFDERLGGNAAWQTRVVFNKYPTVVSDIDAPVRANGIFSVLPARGRHDFLVS